MTRKRIIKYTLSVSAVIFLLINSVYFKKLDEVKAAEKEGAFDAAVYAQNLWEQKLIPDLGKAIELDRLIGLLQTEPDLTFEERSNALGIGNIRYFLVRDKGEITAIDENYATLALETKSPLEIRIATELIYGNAVRDASGLVDINEFTNTMDFNNVSEELNKIIRNEIIPPFKAEVNAGDQVAFTGAVELNRERLNLETIEVTPIELKIE